MKLGIALIIIGIALFIDGVIRIALGAATLDVLLIIGGTLTGLVLGGGLILYGARRIKRHKQNYNPPLDN